MQLTTKLDCLALSVSLLAGCSTFFSSITNSSLQMTAEALAEEMRRL
jgi:hypothetical protein